MVSPVSPLSPSFFFKGLEGTEEGTGGDSSLQRFDDNKGNRKMLDDTATNLAPLRLTKAIQQGTAGYVTSSAPVTGPEAPDEAQAPPVRKLSERWYVIRHKPFEGFRARNAIRRLGFEAHWPRVIDRKPRRNDVIEPLFPGYLFARFDVTRGGWGRIRRADAVVGVLGMEEGGAPIPVPHGEVERLIAQARAIDLPIEPPEDADASVVPLAEGAEVTILDARLMGAKGLLKSDRGGERVKVLLSILGAERLVQVPRAAVRSVEAA
jgi:transcriptional antiterminator RfaH